MSGTIDIKTLLQTSLPPGPTGPQGTDLTNFVTVTDSYSMTSANEVIISTATSPITVTLPDVSNVKSYFFQNKGTSQMTINTLNSQTINSNLTLILQFTNSSCRIVSTGTEFLIF